jgi:hypothetical protein
MKREIALVQMVGMLLNALSGYFYQESMRGQINDVSQGDFVCRASFFVYFVSFTFIFGLTALKLWRIDKVI